MATTIRAFNIGLYEEHLEEISFLYEQRMALLKNKKWVGETLPLLRRGLRRTWMPYL